MEKHLLELKASLAAAGSAVCAFLSWKGVLAITWIVVMGLDYLSGTAGALKNGVWSSRTAREGLWHKCGMIFSVAVAGITDWILSVLLGNIPQLDLKWPGLALPLVLAWYILTELGSILENAEALGAQVPRVLTRLLKASREAVDREGEK